MGATHVEARDRKLKGKAQLGGTDAAGQGVEFRNQNRGPVGSGLGAQRGDVGADVVGDHRAFAFAGDDNFIGGRQRRRGVARTTQRRGLFPNRRRTRRSPSGSATTASCSESAPAGTGAVAVTSMPTGRPADKRRPDRRRGRLRWLPKSMSRYSASDSAPVGSAKPKLIRGRGVEALGVGDGQVGPSDGALDTARDVAVADPAHLAQLLEPDAELHARSPAWPAAARALRRRSLRSWPVPCDPPAGGTFEATTCSMPNSVQAPQS